MTSVSVPPWKYGNSSHAPLLPQPSAAPTFCHLLAHLDTKLFLWLPKFKKRDLQLPSYRESSVHFAHIPQWPCSKEHFCILPSLCILSTQNTEFRSVSERYFIKSAPLQFLFSKNKRSGRDLPWAPRSIQQIHVSLPSFSIPSVLNFSCIKYIQQVYLTSMNSYHNTEVGRCLGLVFKHLVKRKC